MQKVLGLVGLVFGAMLGVQISGGWAAGLALVGLIVGAIIGDNLDMNARARRQVTMAEACSGACSATRQAAPRCLGTLGRNPGRPPQGSLRIARASGLPHRARYLLLQHDLGRKLLQAHTDWLDAVESALGTGSEPTSDRPEEKTTANDDVDA